MSRIVKNYFTQEELYDLYIVKNMSMLEIANMIGKSETLVRRHIIDFGIPLKTSKEYFTIPITKKELKNLYINQQMTTHEIAKKLNCSQSYISRILRYYQIPLRKSNRYTYGKNNPLWKGGEFIPKTLYSYYKKQAEKRGKSFNITLDDLDKQFKKQNGKCAISGITLKDPKPIAKRKESDLSLDRIDSTKGYDKNNIQWVHKTINMMKWSLSQEEFLSWCKIIAQNNP